MEDFYLHHKGGKPRSECKLCSNSRNADNYRKRDERNKPKREYRARNLVGIRKAGKEYYKNNRFDVAIRHAVLSAKKRAEVKSVPFDITTEYVRSLGNTCALSRLEFRDPRIPGQADLFSPSLDRIKSELGYVEGNVRLILHCLNSMKGSGTDEEILTIMEAVLCWNAR